MQAGKVLIGIFQKMRIKNLRRSLRSDLKKTRLLHLRNVEKPPLSQLSAKRACKGYQQKFNVPQEYSFETNFTFVHQGFVRNFFNQTFSTEKVSTGRSSRIIDVFITNRTKKVKLVVFIMLTS